MKTTLWQNSAIMTLDEHFVTKFQRKTASIWTLSQLTSSFSKSTSSAILSIMWLQTKIIESKHKHFCLDILQAGLPLRWHLRIISFVRSQWLLSVSKLYVVRYEQLRLFLCFVGCKVKFKMSYRYYVRTKSVSCHFYYTEVIQKWRLKF